MKRVMFILTLLFFWALPAATVVRTAYYFETGFCERRPDGTVVGLVPEYIAQIAKINDWQIQPVYCTYDEALLKLERREIDLVGGVPVTPERQKAFHFAAYATGTYRPHIFVSPDSPCTPGQVSTWADLEIAVGPGQWIYGMVESFLKSRGVKCRIRQFNHAVDAETAFARGEVQALCAAGSASLRSAKVLVSFPEVPCYFCTPHSASDLACQLDAAILRLHAEGPEFSDRLKEQFFPVSPRNEINYTDEERRWLDARVRMQLPVVVDISPEMPPFKWLKRTTGHPAGFICNLLDEVSRRTGLTFTYLPPTTEALARTRFLRHKADLWASYGARATDLPGLKEGIRVCEFKPVLVSRTETPIDDLSEMSLGVSSWDREQHAACSRAGVRDLRFFESSDEMMDAVVAGKIDAALMPWSVAMVLRQKLHGEDDLVFNPTSTRILYTPSFDLIPSNMSHPCLTSIIRKCIASFSRSELTAMSYHSFSDAYEAPLLSDRAWMMLVIGVLVVAIFVLATIFTVYSRRLSSALLLAKSGESARAKFLATMSHEIRTPLNAVVGFAEFLRAPGLSEEDIASYADGIHKSSHVLLDLINDVLDLSRLESGKVNVRTGTLDIPGMYSELKQIFEAKVQEKGLRLEFVSPEDTPRLRLSSSHIRQVLLNLIGNAVKFTGSGSVTVAVSLKPRSAKSVDVTMEVSDTGIGISSETLPTIFNPFVQDIATRGGHVYEGTGLGLPIVKRIVEAAGGTVSVTSEPGHGTTFSFVIPAVETEVVVDGEKKESASPDHISVRLPKSVVIVDDVPMNLRVLSLHLKKLGVEDVRSAASGQEALAILAERTADIVLTDMWMPDMNGAELAKHMRDDASMRDIPVVAVTADAATSNSFDMSLFTSVITKPVTREKLHALFASIEK